MANFIKNASEGIRRMLNSKMESIVIPDYDTGPEPTGSYGTVGLTLLRQIFRDHNSSDDRAGFKEVLRRDYEAVFTLTFIGSDCYDDAMEASQLFGFESVASNLYFNWGVAYVSHGNIRRVPEPRQTEFVPVASFDITCHISDEVVNDLEWFNTVQYSGKYLSVDGTVVLTQEGEVSSEDTIQT